MASVTGDGAGYSTTLKNRFSNILVSCLLLTWRGEYDLSVLNYNTCMVMYEDSPSCNLLTCRILTEIFKHAMS